MNPRAIFAGARLQLEQARRHPAQFLVVITSPLFSAMFLSVALHARASHVLVNAVLGPAFIGLWFVSLDLAASIVDDERRNGTLEPMLAAPAALYAVVFGRVLTIAGIGLLTMGESWVVAAVGFDVVLMPRHLAILVLTLAATVLAMTSTATLLAGAFVLTRNAFVLQNSLSYPFYILGGVLLPVSLLPGWLHPVSRLLFLSWSADLLRAAFYPKTMANWQWQVALVVGFAAVTVASSTWVMRVVVRRLRGDGSAAYV